MVSFLLASPVLNPAIITLFLAFFGLKATVTYAAFTFVFAVMLGLLLDKLGFVPENLLANFAGVDNFWAIPLAAVVGIPLYIRTETMIPVAAILTAKGVAPGVVIALILGGAGASLPELSLLN